MSLAGIQYLYKSGAKIDDPEHQISLDEAIIAQACVLPDLSIVALAKRNVGALTESIDKTPYKLLFNGSTNSFSLHNGVQVLRTVDYCIKQNESSSTGRKRLVLVHGNRFLLHLILGRVKTIAEFNTQYLSNENISGMVNNAFHEYWDKVFNAMEVKYPEAYPAHIFKNVGRLRDIVEAMN